MTDVPVADVAPSEVRRQGTAAVTITWSDGHTSTLPNRYLRDNCPCAHCRETRPTYALPIRDAEGVHPTSISAVGRYALGIVWSDGHDSGIYSYRTLRSLCPCEECIPTGAD